MASQHTAVVSDDVDFSQHLQTYRLFTNGMKYGAIGVATILVILAILTL